MCRGWPSRLILLGEVAADRSASGGRIARSPRSSRPRAGSPGGAKRWWPTPVGVPSREAFPTRWLASGRGGDRGDGDRRCLALPASACLSRPGAATGWQRRRSSAFAVVVGQVYTTGLWTGLLVLVYRSRPDLDTADPGGEPAQLPQGPRRVRAGRADPARLRRPSLLLVALQLWQVLRLSGGADVLVVLPVRGRSGRTPRRVRWPPGGHGREPPPQGRRRPIGMTTGTGRPASSMSTATIPPSW